MFSNWFSGDDLERYRTSPHKQRIDAIASSLLRLQYASKVIRQHLHEWLRFSLTLDEKDGLAISTGIDILGGLESYGISWSGQTARGASRRREIA